MDANGSETNYEKIKQIRHGIHGNIPLIPCIPWRFIFRHAHLITPFGNDRQINLTKLLLMEQGNPFGGSVDGDNLNSIEKILVSQMANGAQLNGSSAQARIVAEQRNIIRE
jgi:hypothetical protein